MPERDLFILPAGITTEYWKEAGFCTSWLVFSRITWNNPQIIDVIENPSRIWDDIMTWTDPEYWLEDVAPRLSFDQGEFTTEFYLRASVTMQHLEDAGITQSYFQPSQLYLEDSDG